MQNKKLLKEKIQLEKSRRDIELSRERFLQKLQEENQNNLSFHQYFIKTMSVVAVLVVVVGSTKYFFSAPITRNNTETASIHYEIEEHLNDAYVSGFDENEEIDIVVLD